MSKNAANVPNPAYCAGYHHVNKLGMVVENTGNIGGPAASQNDSTYCQLGYIDRLKTQGGGSYPRGSFIYYLYCLAPWVGAIVGLDTLVSTAVEGSVSSGEFDPAEEPFGMLRTRSTKDPLAPEFVGAISEEDFVAAYADTFTYTFPRHKPDFFGNRPHIPLGLAVNQETYGWSEAYAEDFLLIKYVFRNIGTKDLHDLYVGFYVDGDIMYSNRPLYSGTISDDLCGFLTTWPSSKGCGFTDTLRLSWTADNDGDPKNGDWYENYDWKSCTGIQGITMLEVPANTEIESFNWWGIRWDTTGDVMDYGPRAQPTPGRPYRNFGTGGLGMPEGDRNKYYVMSNREHDFDQIYTDQIRQGVRTGCCRRRMWLTIFRAGRSMFAISAHSGRMIFAPAKR